MHGTCAAVAAGGDVWVVLSATAWLRCCVSLPRL
jgi:hypothetical protein